MATKDERLIATPQTPDEWVEAIAEALQDDAETVIAVTTAAREAFPEAIELGVPVAVALTLVEEAEAAIRVLKWFRKRDAVTSAFYAVEAFALLSAGRLLAGKKALKKAGMRRLSELEGHLVFSGWLVTQHLRRLERRLGGTGAHKGGSKRGKKGPGATGKHEEPRRALSKPSITERPAPAPTRAETPLLVDARPQLTMRWTWPGHEAMAEVCAAPVESTSVLGDLRTELTSLSLFEGFDELLCLPMLQGVDRYWYQEETARKVLKNYQGRVLLADEVGLGKTVEAGLILKEYIVRGLVKRFLVLTPAPLVQQWAEELQTKFGIDVITTQEAENAEARKAVWAAPSVVASLATARRQEHAKILQAGVPFDLIIVDEAHRLKNRSTQSFKLVNQLRSRFMLLLSATPVQNSLVELYNILTLLRPGIFATEKEFRAAYMKKGAPRVPQNRHRMRTLMRDVMIRNTRSLVDVRLPPRQAATVRPVPSTEEAACYQAVTEVVAAASGAAGKKGAGRLGLRQLLSAAGSSPAAAAASLSRREGAGFAELAQRYQALGRGAKAEALLKLLAKNPKEKKLVFVQHRATLQHLVEILGAEGVTFACFSGAMRADEKDAAVVAFKEEVSVLLCTEAGGEGRNLQFCNTVINFDLPWNPMAIEQRIGRVHRIGQTREVFVFNFALQGSLEDQLLRILDEKLNMFELVVGEVGAILGEMESEMDFAATVFDAWVSAGPQAQQGALTALGEGMVAARTRYDAVKALDDELFGDELEAA